MLQPIETAGMTKDDVAVLRDRVRDLIATEVALMKELMSMPRLFASDDDRDLVRAERDVRAAFTGLDLDLRPHRGIATSSAPPPPCAITWRMACSPQHELRWSAFTRLFVLRVWGEMDARHSRPRPASPPRRLTGVMKTLEARQLLRRKSDRADGRRVWSCTHAPTAAKSSTRSCPRSTATRRLVTQALTEDEQVDLARSLRTILRTVDAIDL